MFSIYTTTDVIPYREGGFNTSVRTVPGMQHIVVETDSMWLLQNFLSTFNINEVTGGFHLPSQDGIYKYELINPQFNMEDLARWGKDNGGEFNVSVEEREDLVIQREEELWHS